jgi:inner membrane protein
MMGRSHLASGALVGALMVRVFGVDDLVAAGGLVAVTSIGALLPDFDHDDAMLPRAFGPLGRLVAWVIGRTFGHRGITHSLLGLALLTVALGFAPLLIPFPWWVSVGLVLRCAVHIVGDMLTVSGCPLFWPADRRFRLGPGFRTGHVFETAILCPLMGLAAVVLLGSSLGGLPSPLS